jgi:hypothetical protein
MLPHYRQWRVQRWEARLTELLAFQVDLGGLQELAPSRFVLLDLEIQHPESREVIAKAPRVEINRYRQQWLVRVVELEVEGEALANAWQVLHDAFLCLPRRGSNETHLRFERVKVHGPTESHAMREASVKFATKPDATFLWTEFELETEGGYEGRTNAASSSDATQLAPIMLSLMRRHSQGRQATHIKLHAEQQNPLPCSLAQLIWRPAAQLGSQAYVYGAVEVEYLGDGRSWRAAIGESPKPTIGKRGEVADGGDAQQSEPEGLVIVGVDFENLCWNAPADLTGNGWLKLEQALISDRQIEFLRGAAETRSGRISTALLRRANQQLQLALAPELTGSTPPDTAFLAAYFAFQLDAGSRTANLESGVQGTGGLLAMRRFENGAFPITRLISLLERSVPGGTTYVNQPSSIPLTRLSKLALRWLPVEEPIVDQAKRTAQLFDESRLEIPAMK